MWLLMFLSVRLASRASEAVWVATVVGDTAVEVGAYYDGLCGWIAEVTGRT